MNNRIKQNYRQAIVNTTEHPIFKKGQIINIISEEGEFCLVNYYVTSRPEKIEKKYLIVN
jgi:hypothetical protein